MSYYDDVYLAPPDEDPFYVWYENWEPDEDDIDRAITRMKDSIDLMISKGLIPNGLAQCTPALSPLLGDEYLTTDEMLALVAWAEVHHPDIAGLYFADLLSIGYSQYTGE